MNIWYLISLLIIGLGVVILIGCLLASIFGLLKIVKIINATAARIQQQQKEPLQVQINLLNQTVNQLKTDVEKKVSNLTGAIDCFRDINRNLDALNNTANGAAKQLVKKIKSDPNIQRQTNEWTNSVLGILKRYA